MLPGVTSSCKGVTRCDQQVEAEPLNPGSGRVLFEGHVNRMDADGRARAFFRSTWIASPPRGLVFLLQSTQDDLNEIRVLLQQITDITSQLYRFNFLYPIIYDY